MNPGWLLVEIAVGVIEFVQGVVVGDKRAEVYQAFRRQFRPMLMLTTSGCPPPYTGIDDIDLRCPPW